jgi:UDP-glucose 4-epimerase
MRLLLTGGAGYVGSACLRWLLQHGHDPIAYDDLCEGNAQAVPSGRLVEGDILDTDRLADTLRGHRADAVLHFAAMASVPESIAAPELYWRVNVVGTKSVLDAMRQADVRRIVFSSTAAVYGFHAEMPLRESAAKLPETPYGTTKLACEWVIAEYARAYNMGYTALRYFNASGADLDGQNGEDRRVEAHLIPLVFQAALGRRPSIKVCGTDYPTRDGTCVRDYVHVLDLAQAHQRAVETLEPGVARVYNIGSGDGTTVLEVLRACEEVVGRPIPHELAERRPGDPAVLVASPQRLVDELGWSPRYSEIRSIVETAWRWHHTHPHGYGARP